MSIRLRQHLRGRLRVERDALGAGHVRHPADLPGIALKRKRHGDRRASAEDQRLELPLSHAGTRGIAASTRSVEGAADSEIPYPSPYPAVKLKGLSSW